MSKTLRVRNITTPKIPNKASRVKTRKPWMFGHPLAAKLMDSLSTHMNSETHGNISDFLSSMFKNFRNVNSISLLLVPGDQLNGTLEHYVTISPKLEERRRCRNGESQSDSFIASVDLNKESTIDLAVRTGNGGKGFFFEQSGKLHSFSLIPGDYELQKLRTREKQKEQTLIVPLKSLDSERVLGALVIKGKDLRLKKKMRMLSALTYVAFASRQLYSIVGRQLDSLTKLAKKEILVEALNLRAKRFIASQEEENNFSLVASDIDHFRKFNNDYGHQMGDKKLIEVASIMRSTMRSGAGKNDIVARYGGEEIFTLVNAGLSGAAVAAERLRANVEINTFDETTGNVTLSLGAVDARMALEILDLEFDHEMIHGEGSSSILEKLREFDPEFNALPRNKKLVSLMICLSDQALYQTKEKGRNGVTTVSWSSRGAETILNHHTVNRPNPS